jgi:hypothetical protein
MLGLWLFLFLVLILAHLGVFTYAAMALILWFAFRLGRWAVNRVDPGPRHRLG